MPSAKLFHYHSTSRTPAATAAYLNIYKDKDGKVFLVPVKKDSGLSNVETGMTWDEVLEDYPAKKKGAETDAGVEEIAEEMQE